MLNKVSMRNTTVEEKLEHLEKSKMFTGEDDSVLTRVINEIKNGLTCLSTYIDIDLAKLLDSQPQEDIDKLKILKASVISAIAKEQKRYSNITIKLSSIRSMFSSSNSTIDESLDDSYDNDKDNTTGESSFKMNEKDIKNLSDMALYKKERLEGLREQGKYISKITKDIKDITKFQTKTLENLESNVKDTAQNAEETVKQLVTSSKTETELINSRCYIICLISFALFFLILLNINIR